MSTFKGILNNWEYKMKSPVVTWVALELADKSPCFDVSGSKYFYVLSPSKVNPPKDIPRQFQVLSVYKFTMHEDMRLTVLDIHTNKTSELQFVYNEAFIKAVTPQAEKKEPEWLYRVEEIIGCYVIGKGSASRIASKNLPSSPRFLMVISPIC
jgi:hypothetical protein